MYALSGFFLEALRTTNFILSSAFIVSHKFEYVVPSSSLNSKMSSYFFLDHLALSRVLFCLHVYGGFLLFLLLLKTSLSPWRSNRMHQIISIFLYQFKLLFVIKRMVNFVAGTMRYREEGIFFCFRMKYSFDICYSIVSNSC